jgi:hypothetical protein
MTWRITPDMARLTHVKEVSLIMSYLCEVGMSPNLGV